MSAMMQFHGKCKRNRHGNGVVGLEMYLTEEYTYHYWYPDKNARYWLKVDDGENERGEATGYIPCEPGGYWCERTTRIEPEPVYCPICGEFHPRLWVAYRRPIDTMGCWVVFRLNGEEIVPDLSCPMDVKKLPRDAQPMTDEENAIAWHRS